MADHTHIEWTDATWNPITGCTLVSAGCDNCYAAELTAGRLKNHPSRQGLARRNAAGVAKFTGEVRFNEKWLDQPMRWRKPRRIFVCAHSDLFHESVPDEWIDPIFAVMALCPRHTFQVLTKRPDRMMEYVRWTDNKRWPDHVWAGVSVENQYWADRRIPALLDVPANVRFLSVEPLLKAVDLRPFLDDIQWVIVGGESGAKARPLRAEWVRQIRDDCLDADRPFFFKQWGGRTSKAGGRTLDGRTWNKFPSMNHEYLMR